MQAKVSNLRQRASGSGGGASVVKVAQVSASRGGGSPQVAPMLSSSISTPAMPGRHPGRDLRLRDVDDTVHVIGVSSADLHRLNVANGIAATGGAAHERNSVRARERKPRCCIVAGRTRGRWHR